MLIAVVVIVTALILGFAFIIYKKIDQSNKQYQSLKQRDKAARSAQPMKMMASRGGGDDDGQAPPLLQKEQESYF